MTTSTPTVNTPVAPTATNGAADKANVDTFDLKAHYRGPNADPLPGNLIVLKRRDIAIDQTLNSRGEDSYKLDSDGMSEGDLKASIAEHGIRQPPTVFRNPDGTYTLAYGRRRLNTQTPDALVKCIVMSSHGAGLEATRTLVSVTNLAENVARKQLSPVELADALVRARNGVKSTADVAKGDYALTVKQISAGTGMSPSHVTNMITFRTKLLPSIWLDWSAAYKARELASKKGEKAPVCVPMSPDMFKIARMDHSAQADAYKAAKEYLESVAAGTAPEGGKGDGLKKGGGASGGGYKLRHDKFLEIESTVKRHGLRDFDDTMHDPGSDFQRGFLACCMLLDGTREWCVEEEDKPSRKDVKGLRPAKKGGK